jgi:hypothetical protein
VNLLCLYGEATAQLQNEGAGHNYDEWTDEMSRTGNNQTD